jgi:superfamily II DNA or RNA helicase
MIQIEKNLIKITYTKILTSDDVVLVKTLGARYNGTEIIFDLNKTVSKAAMVLIKKFCPSIYNQKNAELEEERKKLFGYIGAYYSSLSNSLDSMLDIIPYKDELFPYQIDAVKFIITRNFSLLAAQQGTGKSVVALTADIVMRAYQDNYAKGITLLISKPTAKHNIYEDWVDTWGLDKNKILVIDATTRVNINIINKFTYVLVNYDILHKNMLLLQSLNISCVIFDEAHRVKTTTTDSHVYSDALLRHIEKKNPLLKVMVLSGTLQTNWTDDYFAYFKLGNLELGKNKEKFKKLFLEYKFDPVMQRNSVVGSKNEEMLADLLSNIIFRIKHEGNTNTKGYKTIRYAFDTNVVNAELDAIYAQIEHAVSRIEVNSKQLMLNRITGLAKVSGTMLLVKHLLEQGKKVVVFSYFTDVIQRIEDECIQLGFDVFKAVGKTKPKDRVAQAKAFNLHTKPCLFIGQTVAAGESINLPASYNIIVNDLPNTWALLEQVIYRLIRVSQTQRVNLFVALCKGTCDEKNAKRVMAKHKSSAKVLDNGVLEIEGFYEEEASFVNGVLTYKTKSKEEIKETPKINSLSNIKFIMK